MRETRATSERVTNEMVEAFMAELEAQHVALDEFSEPIYPVKVIEAVLDAMAHNHPIGEQA